MYHLKNLKYNSLCNLQKAIQYQRSNNFSLLSTAIPTTTTTDVAQKKALNALNENYGQPTPMTHPHLLGNGELTPLIGVPEYQERRKKLMRGIQKLARDNHQAVNAEKTANKSHLVIIPSATKQYMSDKIPYPFRQNTDFMYLSGCLEQDTVLTMFIDEQGNVKSSLFMRPKDKNAELWDGARTGVDMATELFGIDEAFANNKFYEETKKCIDANKPTIWYDEKKSALKTISNNLQDITSGAAKPGSPNNFIHGMRLFKSNSEQKLMRRTCDIASAAINEVMHETRPGHSEHHIYAMTDYKCRMKNASYLAYPPVVASGKNATTIHYINNCQLTKSGDLVLMDAGCEYGGYSSDITRTWPVNGTFTEPQKIIYDVVLALQKDLMQLIMKEGGNTLDNLFDTMCIKLGKYLQEISLVPKDISGDSEYARAGFRFCPHHVSHYLGMDVHDVPLMPRNLRLLPGMVFTMEPGIYISEECNDVPKEFRGIGVRIEDDVLITSDNEVEILTASCIKERKALENLQKEKADNNNINNVR